MRLLARALEGEMTAHLRYAKRAAATGRSGNAQNGTTSRRVEGSFGEWEIRCRGIGIRVSPSSWCQSGSGGSRG